MNALFSIETLCVRPRTDDGFEGVSFAYGDEDNFIEAKEKVGSVTKPYAVRAVAA